jgi:branched-chain amino acid transport system ATP-binding protein
MTAVAGSSDRAISAGGSGGPMLALKDVHTYYGNIHALQGVSMEVGHGEIVTLIGANGAGKTTTLKTISGLLSPRRGTVSFEGQDIARTQAHLLVKMGIGHAPEGRRIFSRLTVLENLQMGAFTRDLKTIGPDIDRVLTLFPRLRERITQQGGTLSGGEQQMLAIGRALMARPKVLLLDEPSMGLAPMVISQIFKIIAEINSQGTTVLLVEQNAQQALTRSDRAYILETGEVTREGNARDLLADDSIRAAYLGVA